MQYQKIRTALVALSVLAVSLTTTACEPPRPQIGKIPADRLVCLDEPAVPVGNGPEYVDADGVTRRAVTDEQDGEYKLALRASWHSCYMALDWVRVFSQTE
jgi:hypothetical protein